MADTAIQMDGLTRSFGSVQAVNQLSLEVPAGIIFGFLGPNGAGKTTTIRLLLGILAPSSGSARIFGFDTHTQADEVRTRTGALLEHTGIYELMSAEENLEFYGRVWRMSATERKTRIHELLEHMGLWDRRKEKAKDWSRGMKQKLALARALLHRPPLLLLDEPTAGLDVMAAVALRDYLASIAAREGTTIFLTTHNMAEAEKLCQRIAVIRSGELVAIGHPDELRAGIGAGQVEIVGDGFREDILLRLRQDPCIQIAELRNGHLFIEMHDNADPAPIIGQLVSAGVMVREVRRSQASLEDVFVTLMEENS